MLKLIKALIFGWVLSFDLQAQPEINKFSKEAGIILIRTTQTISTYPYIKTSEQTRIVLDLHRSTLTFVGEDNSVETYPLTLLSMDENGVWVLESVSNRFYLTTNPQTCRMISIDGKINVLWKN